MDPLNRLTYFVLQFKTDNILKTEGIYALNLGHARDRLKLFYPEAYDIHHLNDEPSFNPMVMQSAAGTPGKLSLQR
jgi:hypothetical protein